MTSRTASKDVRKAQLIDATITAIARHGVRRTTTSLISETAGLSTGLVNFHFKSKQKLFEETILFLAREHYHAWHRKIAKPGLDAAGKLAAIVDAHFDRTICTPRKLAVWYAFFGEAGRRTVYRHLVNEIDDERFAVTVALCRQIREDGNYPSGDDTGIAQTLEALYDGFSLHVLMYPKEISRGTARQRIRRFLAGHFPDHFPDSED